MVGFGLLLAGLHLVDGARLERHPLLLRTGEGLQAVLVPLLGKGHPVHHVPGVVDLEEGLQFTLDRILHPDVQREMQRLPGNGLQPFR